MNCLQPKHVVRTFSLLAAFAFTTGWAISCFECHSLDGNLQACEDEFQPYNVTGHLYRRDCIVPTCMRPSAQLWCLTGGAPLTVISQIYRRDCTVGHLGFEAFYCIKIKGVKRSQCGDIFFEQGDEVETLKGCLATCNFDGCNAAVSVLRITPVTSTSTSFIALAVLTTLYLLVVIV